MPDSALVLFHNVRDDRVSCVVHLVIGGALVPEILGSMDARGESEAGLCARFTALAVRKNRFDPHCCAVHPIPKELEEAIKLNDIDTIAEFSCGEAGLVVVNAHTLGWQAYGGYLEGVMFREPEGV